MISSKVLFSILWLVRRNCFSPAGFGDSCQKPRASLVKNYQLCKWVYKMLIFVIHCMCELGLKIFKCRRSFLWFYYLHSSQKKPGFCQPCAASADVAEVPVICRFPVFTCFLRYFHSSHFLMQMVIVTWWWRADCSRPPSVWRFTRYWNMRF